MEPDARLSSRECVNHPYFEGLKEEFGVAADFETPLPDGSTAAGGVMPLPRRPGSGFAIPLSAADDRDSGNGAPVKTSPLAASRAGASENVAPK